MRFEAKIFKLGNSRGIYIPKNIPLETGEVYTFEVETEEGVYTEKKVDFPIRKKERFNTEKCLKHGGFKGTCGCL